MYKGLSKKQDLSPQDVSFTGDVSAEDVVVRDDLTVRDAISCVNLTASGTLSGNISSASVTPSNMTTYTVPQTDGSKKLVNSTMTHSGGKFQTQSGMQVTDADVEVIADGEHKGFLSRNDQTSVNGGYLDCYKSRNNTGVLSGDYIGQVRFRSYGDSAYNICGGIYGIANSNHTNSSRPIRLEFSTTNTGEAYDTTRMVLQPAGELMLGNNSLVNPDGVFHVKENSSKSCVYIEQAGSGNLIETGGSTPFIVDASGNVGVQRSSASASLHINDTSQSTPTITSNTGCIIEDPTNHEGSTGGSGLGNGLWFRADAQNRYTSSGAVLRTLAGIRAAYPNLTLSDATQASMGLEFYTSDGNSGGNPPIPEFSEKMRLAHDGSLNIGTTSSESSALLNVASTSKGLLPPRMTTAQKTAISSPVDGLVVYDTDLDKLCVYSGSTWKKVAIEERVWAMGKPSFIAQASQGIIKWDSSWISEGGEILYTGLTGYISVTETAYYRVTCCATFGDETPSEERACKIQFRVNGGSIMLRSYGQLLRTEGDTGWHYCEVSLNGIVQLSPSTAYVFEFESGSSGSSDLMGDTHCTFEKMS